MSIYREEAVEALIEALQRKDLPSSQVMALATLSSLSGRHSTASRKPYMECWLLKIAGFEQPYNAMMRAEEMTNETEFADMVLINYYSFAHEITIYTQMFLQVRNLENRVLRTIILQVCECRTLYFKINKGKTIESQLAQIRLNFARVA